MNADRNELIDYINSIDGVTAKEDDLSDFIVISNANEFIAFVDSMVWLCFEKLLVK